MTENFTDFAQLELPFPMYVQYLRGPFISLANY